MPTTDRAASLGRVDRFAFALATLLLVLAVVGVSLRMTFGPGVFARIADRF